MNIFLECETICQPYSDMIHVYTAYSSVFTLTSVLFATPLHDYLILINMYFKSITPRLKNCSYQFVFIIYTFELKNRCTYIFIFPQHKMSFAQNWISRMVFTFIGIAAIGGNALVLWVFFKKRKKINRTAFDILIIGLAMSDFLAGFFMFFSEYVFQPPIPENYTRAMMYCSLLWGGFFLFSLGHVSVYICCVLAFERWLAITKPFYYRKVKAKHAIVTLTIIWIWALILNTNTFISIKTDFDEKVCKWMHPKIGNGFVITSICLQSIVPFSIIIIFYSCLYYKVRDMKRIKGTKDDFKRRLTIIALVASLALVVGWLPNEISYMMLFVSTNRENHLEEAAHVIFTMFAMCNSFINPILYGIYSSKFRDEYKQVLTFKKCTDEENQNTEQTLDI